MNDFTDLVRKMNEISAREAGLPKPDSTNAVSHERKAVKETATVLTKFNEIMKENPAPKFLTEQEKIAEEEVQEEQLVTDLRSRFSDFLKSEVQQGNDLSTIATAVHEGTDSAQKIDKAFNIIFKHMETLSKITRNDGLLANAITQEGGDVSFLDDANQKIQEANSAIEEAHMYAKAADHTEDE